MNRVPDVKSRFEFISFTHIFRKFNSKADFISKSALSLQQEYEGDNLLSEAVKALL
jgi:hypothetical protein